MLYGNQCKTVFETNPGIMTKLNKLETSKSFVIVRKLLAY